MYHIRFSLPLFLQRDILDVLECLCQVFVMDSFYDIYFLAMFLARNESSLLGG